MVRTIPPPAATPPPPEVPPPPPPVDGVFATAVLSPTRVLAVFYWGRSMHGINRPLILFDFEVEPLVAATWTRVGGRLKSLTAERRARYGDLGVFVEGEHLAQLVADAGLRVQRVPAWLVTQDAWHAITQASATHMVAREVVYTDAAKASMASHPFLNASGVAAGPRGDDPTVTAFLYGVVLALDEALSHDPKPKKMVRAPRN